MQTSRNSSLTWIRANAVRVVKPALHLWILVGIPLTLLSISDSWSAEEIEEPIVFQSAPPTAEVSPPNSDTASAPPVDDSNLPEIEAKTFPIKTVRRSNSNKIYLFEDIKKRLPDVGRILLLRRG